MTIGLILRVLENLVSIQVPQTNISSSVFLKPLWDRLASLLIFAILLTACQPTRQSAAIMVPLPAPTTQPLPSTQEHALHPITSPDPSSPWASYTNANETSRIAIDPSGAIWSAGRGGVVHWDPSHGIYTSYTVADGLPENYVTAIALASNGEIWVGTQTGYVAFFSQAKWEVLDLRPGETITCLAIAPDGTRWFGTNRGLHSYDGQAWRSYTTKQGLVDDYVQSLAVTSDGTVWTGGSHGVAWFDGQTWRSRRFPVGTVVTAIVEAPDRSLWLGLDGVITHFDHQTWTTYPAAFGSLTAMAVDPQGDIWIASGQEGVLHFDAKDLHLTRYPFLGFSSLAFDNQGNLWLGSLENGITRFDGQTQDTYRANACLVDNFVIASAVSADGSLWFGTDRGVSRFNGQSWQSYRAASDPENAVLSIAASPDGSLWFGTEGGVSHFDGTSWRTYTTQDGLADNRANALAIAPDGILWVATQTSITRFDGTRWDSFGVPDGFPKNSLRAITAGTGGIAWVGTSSGIARFDGQKFLPVLFPVQETVTSIVLSPVGDLWIGTLRSGVFYLDAGLWERIDLDKTQKIRIDPSGIVNIISVSEDVPLQGNYWKTYTRADGLASDQVNALTLGPRGEVWAAGDHGISYLKAGAWLKPPPDWLWDQDVRTIDFDQQGLLWIGTPLGGVSRIKP